MPSETGHEYPTRLAQAQNDRERALLEKAKKHHDNSGCSCDPRYLTVCRVFQAGLLARD